MGWLSMQKTKPSTGANSNSSDSGGDMSLQHTRSLTLFHMASSSPPFFTTSLTASLHETFFFRPWWSEVCRAHGGRSPLALDCSSDACDCRNPVLCLPRTAVAVKVQFNLRGVRRNGCPRESKLSVINRPPYLYPYCS